MFLISWCYFSSAFLMTSTLKDIVLLPSIYEVILKIRSKRTIIKTEQRGKFDLYASWQSESMKTRWPDVEHGDCSWWCDVLQPGNFKVEIRGYKNAKCSSEDVTKIKVMKIKIFSFLLLLFWLFIDSTAEDMTENGMRDRHAAKGAQARTGTRGCRFKDKASSPGKPTLPTELNGTPTLL